MDKQFKSGDIVNTVRSMVNPYMVSQFNGQNESFLNFRYGFDSRRDHKKYFKKVPIQLTDEECEKFKNIDLVVVDPPRAGLDKKTKENLIRISPKMIAYTSCDPVTLARDIKDLSQNYEVKYIQPFNNFPRTYHLECVCIMKINEN